AEPRLTGYVHSSGPSLRRQSPNAYPTEGETAKPELGNNPWTLSSAITPCLGPMGIITPPASPAKAPPALRQIVSVCDWGNVSSIGLFRMQLGLVHSRMSTENLSS